MLSGWSCFNQYRVPVSMLKKIYCIQHNIMNNNLNFEEDINLELEQELEERKLSTIMGFVFLAVWILSILILIHQNWKGALMNLWFIFTLLVLFWAGEILFTGYFEKYAVISLALLVLILLSRFLKNSKHYTWILCREIITPYS